MPISLLSWFISFNNDYISLWTVEFMSNCFFILRAIKTSFSGLIIIEFNNNCSWADSSFNNFRLSTADYKSSIIFIKCRGIWLAIRLVSLRVWNINVRYPVSNHYNFQTCLACGSISKVFFSHLHAVKPEQSCLKKSTTKSSRLVFQFNTVKLMPDIKTIPTSDLAK